MSPTLVLGAAVGYSEAQIEPFLRSLRRSGYAGDVTLLVAAPDLARLRGSPALAGVTLLGVPQFLPLRWPRLERAPLARWVWAPLHAALWASLRALALLPLPASWRAALAWRIGARLLPPTESRFLRFHSLLRRQPRERVLLTDVRDVLFQLDPFAALPTRGLAVGMEVAGYTLGTEPWNRSRLQLIYGAEAVAELAHHPVSCSGVTAGDGPAILAYLDHMAAEILSLPRRAARQGWFDQALHNVVLRRRWRGDLHELATLASPVATLGAVPESALRFDARSRLLNNDGTPVSIVHQYDRKPTARDLLLQSAEPT